MEYILIHTAEEGAPFLEQLKKAGVLAVDTETTGLDVHRDRLRMVQIGAPGLPVLGLLFQEVIGRDWKIVGIVHDEILLEVPKAEADEAAVLLKMVMERAGKDILPSVPCIADEKVADSWAEK